MSKQVSLTYLNDYSSKTLENAVKDAVAQLGVANFIKPKMKVLIKVCLPNALGADTAEITHPAVIKAVSNWVNEMGAECIIADSPYGKYSQDNLESVYLNTGMLDLANQTKCQLNRDLSTFTIPTPNGVITKSVTLLDIVNKVDAIINIGKLKIDENLGYIGASANLFGLVPGEMKTQVLSRLMNHKDFHNYILDVYDVLKNKIVFNIIDGIVALEHDNTQRMMCCLGVAQNMFSLDAAMIDILNIGYKNTILRSAKNRGLFDFEKGYKTINEKVEKFKVEDFNIGEFNEATLLNSNAKEKAKYFKKHHLRMKIEKSKCKGCAVCSKICPTGAITMQTDSKGELYAEINYSKCIYCNKCHTACPYKVVDVINPIGNRRLAKEFDKQNNK